MADENAAGEESETDILDRRAGTLERGLAILRLLTQGRRLSAGKIAADLDLSRSATYRILGVLRQHGYLDWDDSSDSIRLGRQAVLLGMAALHSFDPFATAQSALRGLSKELGEAALLAVRDGHEMVYVVHEDVTDHSIAMRRLLGVRRHLHSTSLGKAYLAALPPEEAEGLVDQLDLVAMTPTTITDPAGLKAELAAIRDRGYAVDNAENEPDVMCFGAAILDDRGWPVCAISVAGPQERMRAKHERIPARLVETAADVSNRLGYVEHDDRA